MYVFLAVTPPYDVDASETNSIRSVAQNLLVFFTTPPIVFLLMPSFGLLLRLCRPQNTLFSE